MKPWNRRLKDLSLLLNNCEKTYFEPELFRMNANQFLQTSRTVTFLIQKNKNSIPFFESWYLNTVVNAWSSDVVMTWAKDSRNKIEKQGDINYFSTLIATLVISYFHREDIFVIPKEDRDSLWLNINRLIKFVQPKMTEEAFDNSVVRIERKWVANSLPDWELLQAFTYIYSQQYRVCDSLQKNLELEMEEGIPDPGEIDLGARKSRQISYISLKDGAVSRLQHVRIMRDPDFKVDDGELLRDLAEARKDNGTVEGALSFHAAFTQSMFELQGEYFPSIFMYDENGKCIYNGGTEFADQASKHMYWRLLGEQIISLSPTVVVWSLESWIRDYKNKDPKLHFRDREIIGERLSVTVVDKNIRAGEVHWEIKRDAEGAPTLGEPVPSMDRSKILLENNVLAPVVEAFVFLSEHQGSFKEKC